MSRKCHTPNCEVLVGERSIIGLCPRCYGAINYWHKKSPKALVKRAQQLQLYRGRMDLMMPAATSTMPYKKPKHALEFMPGEIRKGKKRKAKKVA
jgi:hypothetical protein